MRTISLTLAFSLLASVGDTFAQDLLTESELIIPPDTQMLHRFGHRVALDGDTLLATTPRKELSGGRKGIVSVYVRDAAGWSLEQRIESPDSNSHFGSGLALDGDRLVIGRHGWNFDQGALEIWQRSAGTWMLDETIYGLAGTHTLFGFALDLDGDRLLVGAHGADHNVSGGGAAYVYLRGPGGWALEQELVPPVLDHEAGNGFSVALDGDVAVCGAPGGYPRQGRASIFRRDASGWQFEAQVRSSDGSWRNRFGHSLALDAGVLAVGEPDVAPKERGRVHVFRDVAGHWEPDVPLGPPGSRRYERFGYDVALNGGTLASAGWRKTTYVFEDGPNGWTPVAQLAPALEWSAAYVPSVDLSDAWVLVGNFYDPTAMVEGGAVRVYERPFAPLASVLCTGDAGACPCGNDSQAGALEGCLHSDAWGAQLVASGTVSLAREDLKLHGRALQKYNAVAALFAAPTVSAPLPMGDGLGCLGAGAVRLGVRTAGELEWGPGLFAPLNPNVGETWFFQAAFRDVDGACGGHFNWTVALAVTIEP